MNLTNLSLKRKLTLALVVAVIASASLIGFVSQFSSRVVVADRMEHRELPAMLTSIRNQVDKEISIMQATTEQLATNAFILKWVEDGFPAEQESILLDQLNRIKEQHDLITVSFVDRQSRRYWNQDGFLRVLEPGPADGWFFAFTSGDDAQLKSLYTEHGITKLFVNYQMLDGRGLSGVARPVGDLVQKMNQQKIEQSGFVYLVDNTGLVKIHKNQSLLDKATLESQYGKEASRQLLRNQDFSLAEVDINGVKTLVATSYIKSAGWYIVAEVPSKEVFAALDTISAKIVVWIIVATILFASLAWFLSGRLTRPITHLADVFKQLGSADGDLNVRLEKQSTRELIELQQGFNQFVDKIQKTINEVAQTSHQLKDHATETANTSQLTLESGQTQSEHTEQIALAINEMNAAVNDVNENAHSAASAADHLEQSSVQGQQSVMKAQTSIASLTDQLTTASDVIHHLATQADSIGSILDVIRSVSDQTNLLALNAAIEAARAGDHGRGFAVVADEVRTLAQKTGDSTEEIQETINKLQQESAKAVDAMKVSQTQAETGVEAIQSAEAMLTEITDGIATLRGTNNQVASATHQQSAVTNEISNNISVIKDDAHQTLSQAEAMAQASKELTRLAEQLDRLVSSFK